MHVPKKGLRAFGIAESYSGRTLSTLAGVVMRKDLRIDGFSFGTVTVGGVDATDTILAMIRDLERSDLNVVMLSGCVIAWFNVISPVVIHEKTGLPVICVTYEDSDGLLGDIRRHFPDDLTRVTRYMESGNVHRLRCGRTRPSSSVHGALNTGMRQYCVTTLPLKVRSPNHCAWHGSAPGVLPLIPAIPVKMLHERSGCYERCFHMIGG